MTIQTNCQEPWPQPIKPGDNQPELPFQRRRGFTLLELIVVIVILGILAAIAIPTFQRTIGRSTESTAQATLLSIDRGARALAAMDDEPVSFGDYEVAAGEVTAAADGPSAAGLVAVQVFDADSEEAGAAAGEVAVHLTSTTSTIAMLTPDGTPVYVTGGIAPGTSSKSSVGDAPAAKADPRALLAEAVDSPTSTTPTTSNPQVPAFAVTDDHFRVSHQAPAQFHPLLNDSVATEGPASLLPNSYRIVSAPSYGSAVLLGDAYGTLRYTPAAGFQGIDELTYEWCHAPTGVCGEGRVFIDVTMQVESLTVREPARVGEPVAWTVAGHTTAPSYLGVSQMEVGNVTVNDVVYTPAELAGGVIPAGVGSYSVDGETLTFTPGPGSPAHVDVHLIVTFSNGDQVLVLAMFSVDA